jgi:hypothetical protein
METAKQIIEYSLPIKCLEAVILSIYLLNLIETTTNSQPNSNTLRKFTIGFKTVSNGNEYRHVVLGVYCHSSRLFGALGISRRIGLAYKELKYKTLTDLLNSFIEFYSNYLHRVKRIKIGLPISNENRSFAPIVWNGCSIVVNCEEWSRLVEKYSRKIRQEEKASLLLNSLPLMNRKVKYSSRSHKSFYENQTLNNNYQKVRKNQINSVLSFEGSPEQLNRQLCESEIDEGKKSITLPRLIAYSERRKSSIRI